MRFPEFKEEWQESSLNDIADFSKGQGISKDQRSDIGSPCILYGELYTTYSSEIIDKVFSKTNIDSTKLVKSKANDIIIPASGETAIDIATARCVKHDNVLLGGDLNIIRMKDDNNFGDFFCYELNGIRRFDIAQIAQGVSVVHLHASDLKGINVRFPSFQEQRKIANFLSLLDKRIEIQKSVIEKLKSLMAGICSKLLNPKEAHQIPVKNFLIERIEKTTVNNQYEVLSSTIKGLFSQKEYFSKEIASENNTGYKIIRRKDVVLSPQNLYMGNINFNDKFEVGIVSPSYKIYSISDDFNKTYVSNVLRTHRALFKYMLISEQGASIVRRNLNIEDFEKLKFPFPTRDEQDKTANKITAINHKIELENSILMDLMLQKSYLLSKMFI